MPRKRHFAIISENNECPQGHYDKARESLAVTVNYDALKTTNARKGITTDADGAQYSNIRDFPSENNECPQGHYDQASAVPASWEEVLTLKTTNARKGITTL